MERIQDSDQSCQEETSQQIHLKVRRLKKQSKKTRATSQTSTGLS